MRCRSGIPSSWYRAKASFMGLCRRGEHPRISQKPLRTFQSANSGRGTSSSASKIEQRANGSCLGPNNPESLNFFQADTYRFYFLMSFMWEALEGNEISQEYAISLVPKKFASRIKRLQVLKQAVQLRYIDEQQSQVDRRRRIYFPSDTLLNDFVQYANDSDKAVKIDKAS